MKNTARFEIIPGKSSERAPAPSRLGIHVTVAAISIAAAFGLAAQATRNAPAQETISAATAAPASETTEYFPGKYVNQGTETPEPVQTF